MTRNSCQYQTEINSVNQLLNWKNSYETYLSAFDIINTYINLTSTENIFFNFQLAFICYNYFQIMVNIKSKLNRKKLMNKLV